jgi:glycosyltransferase involved in cell wall biosynthesis
MRIIQIIDVRWYNACADFAIKQALGLQLTGNRVLLMANPGSPPALKAREAGLDVDDSMSFAGPGRVATAPKRLREIASGYGANVLFAHRGESHLIAGLSARGTKLRVARFRGDVRLPRNNVLSRWINGRLTHGIAVSTERLKLDYERKFRLDGIPCRVIYPGLEPEILRSTMDRGEARRRFHLAEDRPVAGIVGRLSPVKGHRYFLEAAKLVSLKYPQCQFVVAGEDAQISNAELAMTASALKIPNIKFTGLIDNLPELLRTFDIGVIASIGSEMICRVLLEYFAAGLPVVATSVNQISELMLASGGGILIQSEDSPALAGGIMKLLADREKRSRLAISGSEWVKTRSLKALGCETEGFLAEVCHA